MEKKPYTKPELEKQANLSEVVQGVPLPVSAVS